MATRGVSWPAIIFFGLTWGTFLAGIIILQINCNDGTTGQGTSQVPKSSTPDNLNTMGTAGIFGWSGRVLPCTRLFRFYWFMVAFGFVTLLGAVITAFPRRGLRSSRPFWVGMFTINSLLFMIASEAMWAAFDSAALSGSTGLQVATAGAISTAASSILVMLAVGTDWEFRRRRSRDDKALPHRYRNEGGEPIRY